MPKIAPVLGPDPSLLSASSPLDGGRGAVLGAITSSLGLVVAAARLEVLLAIVGAEFVAGLVVAVKAVAVEVVAVVVATSTGAGG